LGVVLSFCVQSNASHLTIRGATSSWFTRSQKWGWWGHGVGN